MSIEIKGVAEVIARLGKMAVIQVLEAPMRRAVNRLQYVMRDYPPAPSGSRYIRGYGFRGGPRTSENLGKRWTTKIETSARGLTGKVSNNASYDPLVQSERFQTRTHRRTGWPTDERAVRENERAIVADFEQAIQKALR